MAGGVFRQELNWSSFQNEQMNVLKSLSSSLDKSFEVSKDISQTLSSTKSFIDHTDRALTSLLPVLSNVEQSIVALTTHFIPEFKVQTTEFVKSLTVSRDTFDAVSKTAKKLDEVMDESTRRERERIIEEETAKRDHEEYIEGLKDKITKGITTIAKLLDTLGTKATVLSDTSNALITVSGAGKSDVKGFRSDFANIVQELNTVTGDYYNTTKSYQQIVATAQAVTGNLNSLKEMSRPLLLASETIDVTLTDIASTFNRLYTRYEFDSLHMETMVGDIRKYSAGSQATGEEIVTVQNALSRYIERNSGGDQDKLTEGYATIAKMTGFFENNGLSADFLVPLMQRLVTGDYLTDGKNDINYALFNKAGYTAEQVDSYIKDTSQWDKLIIPYVEAMAGLNKEILGREGMYTPGVVASGFGTTYDAVLDFSNLTDRVGDLSEALINYDETRDNTSLTQLVDDKYISVQDRIANRLERLVEIAAGIQEDTGVGWTDAASIMTTIVSWKLIEKLFSSNAGKNVLGKLFSGGGAVGVAPTTGGAGGSTLGGTGTAGKLIGASALPAIGAVGGGLIALNGWNDATNENNSSLVRYGGGLELAAGGLAAGALGTAAVAGAAGAAGVATVAGPIGWVALAVGLAAIKITETVKEFEKTHELLTGINGAGNVVQQEFDDIADSMHEKNNNLIMNLSALEIAVKGEQDRAEQKKLIEESGLINLENYVTDSKTSYDELIHKINETVIAMDAEIENMLAGRKEGIAEEQSTQQRNFIEGLYNKVASGDLTEEQSYALLERVFSGIQVTDENKDQVEALMAEFQGYAGEEKKINAKESANLLALGQDSFWSWTGKDTDHILGNFAVDTSTMQLIDNAYGLTGGNTGSIQDYSFFDKAYETELASKVNEIEFQYLQYNKGIATEDSVKDMITALRDSEFYSDAKNYYGDRLNPITDKLELGEFAIGTNYITEDQLAVVHEGEAITPKRYNPAANRNELETLREQNRQQLSQVNKETQENVEYIVTILTDIKNFLAVWKEDNNKRERISNTKNRLDYSRDLLAGYLIRG